MLTSPVSQVNVIIFLKKFYSIIYNKFICTNYPSNPCMIPLHMSIHAFLLFFLTCELKVCTTKKPENPSVFLTLPVAHELSVLCMI